MIVAAPVAVSSSPTVTSLAEASTIAPSWTLTAPVPASPMTMGPVTESTVLAFDTLNVPFPVACTPRVMPPRAWFVAL